MNSKTEQIKVGTVVWVTEHKSDKKMTPLPREWYGEIIEIKGESVQVKDLNPDSDYSGQIFPRLLPNLEIMKVCGTCADWKTCKFTEGWRIRQECSGLGPGGVSWKPKK